MNEKLTDFQQLNVWQKSHQLVLEIFDLTKKFSKDDKAEIAALMRQAAITVPEKIGEGFMRRGPKEKAASYKESQSGIEALKYYLILARDLEFIKESDELISAVDEVGRMLTGLVRSTKTK